MIIAVDGPLASGKGTIARALSQKFALPYLDTGSLYRAAALAVLDAGEDPTNEACAIAAAQSLDVTAIDIATFNDDKLTLAHLIEVFYSFSLFQFPPFLQIHISILLLYLGKRY